MIFECLFYKLDFAIGFIKCNVAVALGSQIEFSSLIMGNRIEQFASGGCTCGQARYRLASPPLYVHCCHCSWCQRETGAAFALNALIEADRVDLMEGEVYSASVPSYSGKGQKIYRCPKCQIAVWSNYAGMGDQIRFVRVGTLDDPAQCPPDIHIYTSTKQPWLELGRSVPAVEGYYSSRQYWPQSSLERKKRLRQEST